MKEKVRSDHGNAEKREMREGKGEFVAKDKREDTCESGDTIPQKKGVFEDLPDFFRIQIGQVFEKKVIVLAGCDLFFHIDKRNYIP